MSFWLFFEVTEVRKKKEFKQKLKERRGYLFFYHKLTKSWALKRHKTNKDCVSLQIDTTKVFIKVCLS